MAFKRPSALSLCVVLSMPACSLTVQILREMPAIGTIPTGHIVYVDDGGLSTRQVKEVTGAVSLQTSRAGFVASTVRVLPPRQ